MNSIDYHKENVKEIYERNYSGTKKSIKELKDEHVSTVIRFRNICKNYKIKNESSDSYLDIACGDGVKTNAISQFFKKSVGLDFSKNAIKFANTTFASDQLNFVELDLQTQKLPEKFNLVTCFGNSTFNVSAIDKLAHEIKLVIDEFLQKNGTLIIGSFTDYSGTAPTGWYNLTEKELQELSQTIANDNKLNCSIYLPHKDLNNYFSGELFYTLKELQKLVFQKRRYFYLVIQ